jgi:hypothetical protein
MGITQRPQVIFGDPLGIPKRTFGDRIPPAGFAVDLQRDLAPGRTVGFAAATFTRATSATFEDFEGVIRTAESGEPRFVGARRVENLVPSSNDFSVVSWTKVSVTLQAGVADPFGGTDATTVTATAGSYLAVNLSTLATRLPQSGDKIRNSLWIRRRTGTGQINLYSGGDAYDQPIVTSSLTSSWQRLSVPVGSVVTAANNFVGVRILTAGDEVDIYGVQSEYVTGQTNQNPSEYVSTGVGTGPELVVNGDFSNGTADWTPNGTAVLTYTATNRLRITSSDAYQYAYQTFPTVIGKAYTVTFQGYVGTSVGGWDAWVSYAAGWGAYVSTGTQITDGSLTFTFTPTSSTSYVVMRLRNQTAVSGAYVEFSNISVKEADHGANIDGVKYFLQTNPNTMLGNVVTSEELHWLELGADGYAGEAYSTDNNFQGDMDIRFRIATDNVPPAKSTVVSKDIGSGNQRHFLVSINTDGTLELEYSLSGSASVATNEQSTVATGRTDNIPYWGRITRNSTTGKLNYYTASDDTQDSLSVVTWIQLGDEVDGTAGSLYASNAGIDIGADFNHATALLTGNVFKIEIFDEIGPSTGTVPKVNFAPETAIADGWTIHSTGTTQIKTNKALTFTEERTGPIALSTALDLDDGFNSSSILHGAVEAFPNLLPPAARVDFTEWTQTGTGSITPMGDGVDEYQSDNVGAVGFFDGYYGIGTARTDNGDYWTWARRASTGYEGYTYQETLPFGFHVFSFEARQNAADPEDTMSLSINSGYPSNFSLTSDFATYRFGVFSDGAAASKATLYSSSGAVGDAFDLKNLQIQAYSYTTLSDSDDSAGEVAFIKSTTIPTDGERYNASITISEGTALATTLRLSFIDVSTKEIYYRYTWATGAFTTISSTAGDVTATATTNADGTVTLNYSGFDTGANTTARIIILPAGEEASKQGTVNVHGDVVLNRVSVAAEPIWNTLKPGASVVQRVLQQQEMDTSPWGDNGTPVKAQDETDIFGVANKAWSIEDNNAVTVAEGVTQGITLTSDTERYCFGIFVKKEAAALSTFPSLLFRDTSVTVVAEVSIDSHNGLVDWVSGNTGDGLGIIDGAVIKSLIPVMVNADNYWCVYGLLNNASFTGFSLFPQAARTTTLGGTSAGSAVGTAVFDMPFVHKGKYPYFFDSIATTTTVTEVVQDWSKIFSYATEASNNVANIVFDHGYLEGSGVNIEGARTNLCLYSEDASNAVYTLSGVAVNTNAAIAPDGRTVASELVEDTGSLQHRIRQSPTLVSGTTYTMSAWVKRGVGTRNVQLGLFAATSIVRIYFDLGSGTVATESNGTGTIEAFSDGWYRISGTGTSDLTGASFAFFANTDATILASETYTGDGTSSVYWHGRQVEAGAFPSSYIPTEASSVGRNADVLTYSAAGIDTFPMTVSADFVTSHVHTVNGFVMDVSDNSSSDRGGIYVATNNALGSLTRGTVGNNSDVVDTTSLTIGTTYSAALVWALDDIEFYVDGDSKGTPDTDAGVGSGLSEIAIGAKYDSTTHLYGNIRNVKIFNKRLTDEQVTKL